MFYFTLSCIWLYERGLQKVHGNAYFEKICIDCSLLHLPKLAFVIILKLSFAIGQLCSMWHLRKHARSAWVSIWARSWRGTWRNVTGLAALCCGSVKVRRFCCRPGGGCPSTAPVCFKLTTMEVDAVAHQFIPMSVLKKPPRTWLRIPTLCLNFRDPIQTKLARSAP